MKCCYCSHENLEKSNFCSKCKNQIKCLECSDVLEENSEICVTCGSDIKKKKINFNTIEFKEGKNTKSFKATFSDEVGQNMAEALGMVIMNRKQQKNIDNSISLEISNEDIIEDVEHTEVKPKMSNIENKVKAMFRESNGRITLLETRLKATSKRDYSIRLTLIFLYYKWIIGEERVLRSELTTIVRDSNVEDGNFRYWLLNNSVIGVYDNEVELKSGGRENAQGYIKDVHDDSKEDKWKVGTSSKKRSKKKEGGNDD